MPTAYARFGAHSLLPGGVVGVGVAVAPGRGVGVGVPGRGVGDGVTTGPPVKDSQSTLLRLQFAGQESATSRRP